MFNFSYVVENIIMLKHNFYDLQIETMLCFLNISVKNFHFTSKIIYLCFEFFLFGIFIDKLLVCTTNLVNN